MDASHESDLGLGWFRHLGVVGDLQGPDSPELHTLTKARQKKTSSLLCVCEKETVAACILTGKLQERAIRSRVLFTFSFHYCLFLSNFPSLPECLSNHWLQYETRLWSHLDSSFLCYLCSTF